MNKDIIFQITLADLQNEVMGRIGRKITNEEIEVAANGVKWGIGAALDITYNTIFTEMINENIN